MFEKCNRSFFYATWIFAHETFLKRNRGFQMKPAASFFEYDGLINAVFINSVRNVFVDFVFVNKCNGPDDGSVSHIPS